MKTATIYPLNPLRSDWRLSTHGIWSAKVKKSPRVPFGDLFALLVALNANKVAVSRSRKRQTRLNRSVQEFGKMLVVWRGFGWLVPVVVFAALILSQLSVDAVYGEGFYTANAWPKQAALILAAVCVGFLGFFLNYTKRKTLIDEETGENLGKAPSHSLFFLPVEYWTLIVLALLFLPKP